MNKCGGMNVSSGREPKPQRTALKNGPSLRYGYERRSLLSEEKPLKPTPPWKSKLTSFPEVHYRGGRQNFLPEEMNIMRLICPF